jgi:murein DD-endopeptidase MepM/ murein hydrolase activator NlpD
VPATPQGGTEGRAGGISGILRRGRAAERASTSPHPTPGLTVSPAVRRLWTALLLALFAFVAAGTPAALGQAVVAVVTEPEGLNLRGGPGTDYVSLAVIPKDTELPVLGAKVNSNWVPVSYQGKVGFVFDQYIELRTATATQPGTATPAALAQPPLAPMGAVQAQAAPQASPSSASLQAGQPLRVNSPEGLNLRAGPGLEHAIQAVIPHNTSLTPVQRSADGKWAQVTYNGVVGWVDSQYLVAGGVAGSGRSDPGPGAAAGSGRYIWPVSGRSITTHFGPGHPAIDIDQYRSEGSPVVASAAGKVTFAGGNACCSYGLYVTVEHRDGSTTLYAHLNGVGVSEGQEVAQGQTLGASGNTGRSTGAHLHFELLMNGSPVNPLSYLPPASAAAPSAPPAPAQPSPSPSPSPVPAASPSPLPSPTPSPSPSR